MKSSIAAWMAFFLVVAGCGGNGPKPEGDRARIEPAAGVAVSADRDRKTYPLVIGESFTIQSGILGEARRVNVYVPTVYGKMVEGPMPVLYMPDGGLDEDFLHIAGLVQVLVSDGSMRPFLLVGIPNTERRRDLTGPTQSEEDQKIAPVVGGSNAFRRFIRDELIPEVRSRYRTTEEAAVIGESLAGLFVVETFFVEPELFTTYIAVDPSLWWNDGELVKRAGERLDAMQASGKTLFVGASNEPSMTKLNTEFAAAFKRLKGSGVMFRFVPFADETHATVYHPAALAGMRAVLGTKAEGK